MMHLLALLTNLVLWVWG